MPGPMDSHIAIVSEKEEMITALRAQVDQQTIQIQGLNVEIAELAELTELVEEYCSQCESGTLKGAYAFRDRFRQALQRGDKDV